MSNMGYCAFKNTLQDLKDCRDRLFDPLESGEASARAGLIQECIEILEDLGIDVGMVTDEVDEIVAALPTDE